MRTQTSGSSEARARAFRATPRHRTITPKSEPGTQVAPNLLQRDFSADQPNTKWIADTTSIWTAEGWLYLAVVLDLFSRMGGGWSIAATQDATLVVHALPWPSLGTVHRQAYSITAIVGVPTPVKAIKRYCGSKAWSSA